MSVPRWALFASAVAVLLQSGCAERPTLPRATHVQLSVTASPGSGSPALPVVVDARAENVWITRVWHCTGCGCGNGFGFSVLGPDGAAVWLSDPKGPWPLCPDGFTPLDPGTEIGDRLVFTGTLYDVYSPVTPTPTYPAPAGLYTVVVRFKYSTGGSEPHTQLERTTTFTWQP